MIYKCFDTKLAEPSARSVSMQAYLTECIYELVLESQLPREIVNLLSIITNYDIKLSISWGS